MAAINKRLLQKIIRFQLELRRLQAGERRKILDTFKILGSDTSKIIGAGDLLSMSKAKLNKLIASLESPIIDAYKQLQEETALLNTGIAEVQLKATHDALLATGVISSGITTPTDATIVRLLADPLIKGGPLSDWWGRQQADTLFKISNAIREGVLLGQNNQEIVSKLVGTKTIPGILEISRTDANALAHTVTQTVANSVQQEFYRANSDIVLSLKWFTALDSHVCPLCIARADKSWTNTEDHKALGHSIPFQVPPIHFNDRCLLLPETEDIGLPVGERASSLGPIKGNTTFKEYLKMVPKGQVEEMLGVGRAALFNDGKITLNQLIDGSGRELTLKELKSRYL